MLASGIRAQPRYFAWLVAGLAIAATVSVVDPGHQVPTGTGHDATSQDWFHVVVSLGEAWGSGFVGTRLVKVRCI